MFDSIVCAGAQQRGRPAQTMLSGIDIPPLEQVTQEHVADAGVSFAAQFPATAGGAIVGGERVRGFVTRWSGGDLHRRWRLGERLVWTSGVSDRQRELSLRFGVNMVMVALTGNYKADQVHVPALLERMGDDRR